MATMSMVCRSRGAPPGTWAPFRPALALLDCLLGRQVRVVAGDGVHAGRAAGLDDSGRLVLEVPDGTNVAVPAGDVHILTDDDPPGEDERADPGL